MSQNTYVFSQANFWRICFKNEKIEDLLLMMNKFSQLFTGSDLSEVK